VIFKTAKLQSFRRELLCYPGYNYVKFRKVLLVKKFIFLDGTETVPSRFFYVLAGTGCGSGF
jgi:hypothetical protein